MLLVELEKLLEGVCARNVTRSESAPLLPPVENEKHILVLEILPGESDGTRDGSLNKTGKTRSHRDILHRDDNVDSVLRISFARKILHSP